MVIPSTFRRALLALAGALASSGCGSDECKCAVDSEIDVEVGVEVIDDSLVPGATALPGPAVRMGFLRTAFFDAPVPALDLIDPNGRPDLSGWPRERGGFIDTLVLIAQTTDGASLAGATYFSFDAALPEAIAADIDAHLDATIINVDLDSPELGKTHPATLKYEADGGPYGTTNMLTVLPIQGVAMQSATRYAVVLTSNELGTTFGRSQPLADLLAGRDVSGLDEGDYEAALRTAREHHGFDPAKVLGVTVFDTADATSELADFVRAAKREAAPDLTNFTLLEEHERFCVYTKTITLPDYQHGAPPFTTPGEGTFRTSGGDPQVARRAQSRVFVTIPRSVAPAGGYPTVVFIRTGGGGDRPLIDRGLRGEAHGEPIVPTGTGPAMNLAAAGWAGITWDGPHGGLRNPGNQDEQFLMFNVTNPAGTRDNIRQTALESVLIASYLDALTIDTSACADASPSATFDADQVAIMGHSMGGWVAPIAMASSPQFKHAILSGAGGSWIANIIHKKSPLDVRPLAEAILGYVDIGRTLADHDPAVTLLQWAGEAADPQSYGHLAMTPQRNVLMIEGIVDTYIMPPIANTTALSLRLDLAGPALDETDERLAAFTPLGDLLGYSGAQKIQLPAHDNRAGHTAVVVQSAGDAIEDGHEAMFQTPGPKHQYRCFLDSLNTESVPTVVAPSDDEWAACVP